MRGEADRTRRESGFTFVELLAVLTLVSIATLFAFLKLDGVTASSRLAGAGRKIGSSIGWLRGDAAAQAREFQIEFDLDNGRYRTIVPPRPGLRTSGDEDDSHVFDWEYLPKAVRLVDIQFTPTDLQNRRSFEDIAKSGSRVVTITRNGSLPSFAIHLESTEIADDELGQFTVEVNGFTGAVLFETGYRELGAIREEHDM